MPHDEPHDPALNMRPRQPTGSSAQVEGSGTGRDRFTPLALLPIDGSSP